ncbi:hypothetical protein KO02_12535 [Sphingobacterium sp. ML3W]|uniref:helix-turn-helix domain-containing protein n=1 Tax=Sphingobacterium sp. ML3W TaxID=1538644 RepID=UPI0004F677A8|nr:helix-turn-helix transcriptional regulator [Sphingobacterium sp. ML3W]AIM37421.1 hypothetical protein KO02_12535 [Sphingobacterium sp. ML3W]
MENTDYQIDNFSNKIADNLNVLINSFFDGQAKKLAEKLNVSKSTMSHLTSAHRLPKFHDVIKLYQLGISADFLIGGKGPQLLFGSDNLEEAQIAYSNSFDIEIKDDKMATTLNHSSIATFKTIENHDLDVGGIYYVKRQLGSPFIARLTGQNQWVFDNSNYKEFEYMVSEADQVAKLIKAVNYHFPTK